MNISTSCRRSVIFALVAGLLGCSDWGRVFAEDGDKMLPYQAALDYALEHGDINVASVLFDECPKPNGLLNSGLPTLVALAQSSGCLDSVEKKQILRMASILLAGVDGVNPNLERKDGATALMIVTQSGDDEFRKLLVQRNATPIKRDEKMSKALLTKVAAELIEMNLDQYIVENNVIDRRISFDMLEAWWNSQNNPKKELPPYLKSMRKDPFGNPMFLDIRFTQPIVRIHPDTLKEAASICDAKFWGDYGKSEKEDNYVSPQEEALGDKK
jgi:hypothetical protein